MSITLDISTQQKHDSQMDEFKTLLLSVTQRELEAHYLTEAKKRLEILTLVAREILSANILKDGAYKIEFVLDKSTTSGVDMPFTQSFNTMFAADSVRMTIDGNTVLYGVKTTHSSMYKMERDVGRLDKGTADENESNIRKEAIALLEKLDRQKNKLNPTEKKELEALRAGVKKWIAFETEMRQGLGSFVADSKKTQEVVEKLNSITRKVIEIKKVRSQKLAKLQKEFIGGLRIRPWPFERPETLLSAFKTASQRSALDNFTVKYLKVIANGQYKGTLSQTNYEPLHGAVVWLRKLVEGGEIENTELVVRKFSALSQKVRAYEKKIRHIAGAITDISLERRLKYLCELQKCRYEVLDAIKEASVAIARLESEGLSLIQNELYRLARNVGKLDFKVEGTLAEEMFKRAGKQQSSDIKFVKSVLARYNNNLPVLEVGLESKRKGIDDAKKTYRENWTGREGKYLEIIENELEPLSPAHAHILYDVLRQVKRHIRFKQGDYLEADLRRYFTPENILISLLYLAECEKLPEIDKPRKEGFKEMIKAKLEAVMQINSQIEQSLENLKTNTRADIGNSNKIAYLEATLHDLDLDVKSLVERKSTDKPIQITYSEAITPGTKQMPKEVKLVLHSENFGKEAGGRAKKIEIEMHTALRKSEMDEVAHRQADNISFDRVLFGAPYSLERIGSDFTPRQTNYLTLVGPLVEGIDEIAKFDRQKDTGKTELGLIAKSVDASALNGIMIKLEDGRIIENPARLLKGKNEIMEHAKSVVGSDYKEKVAEYMRLRKLHTINAMAGIVHMNKFANLNASLKTLAQRIGVK